MKISNVEDDISYVHRSSSIFQDKHGVKANDDRVEANDEKKIKVKQEKHDSAYYKYTDKNHKGILHFPCLLLL